MTASLHLAATYYDIDYETARRRILSGWQGWRYCGACTAAGDRAGLEADAEVGTTEAR
jgi:hypothetical protein